MLHWIVYIDSLAFFFGGIISSNLPEKLQYQLSKALFGNRGVDEGSRTYSPIEEYNSIGPLQRFFKQVGHFR
jgi:hypothetical protein